MSVQIDSEVIGLEHVRERLGNSGQVNRQIGRVLNEAARIGVAVARAEAPKDSHRLVDAIREDNIQFTTAQGFIEASFGVGRVSRATRDERGRFTGSTGGALRYPLWVHEGTGLYGHFHRAITPKRAKAMRFVGRTGIVVTKSVRGQRPQPFMRQGYEAARAYIDSHLDDLVNNLFEP